MVNVLGKRKVRDLDAPQPPRRTAVSSKQRRDSEDDLAVFRRAFEAKFQPLEPTSTVGTGEWSDYEVEDASDSFQEPEWQGFLSQGQEDLEDPIEVVEHGDAQGSESLSKAQIRAFMNSKPPSTADIKAEKKTKAANDDEDEGEGDEMLHLKNDLALQRLIKESHILEQAKNSDSPSGQRQKLIDSRLQSLGSKSSILEQQKMPLSHRKGIMAKANQREAKRRQNAKESGVILEKPAKQRKPSSDKMRVRGVGGPGVGKFKGGTLQLSKRDVAEIQGRPATSSKAKPKLRAKKMKLSF